MTKVAAVLLMVLMWTSAMAATPPDVRVRYGEHEKFSRFVFDWPQAVPYDATLDHGTLTLDFKALGAIDLSAVKKDPPDFIRLEDVALGSDDVKVSFAITKPASLRHFRDGPRVVVDVLFDEEPAKAAEKPKAPEAPKTPKAEPVKETTAAKAEDHPAEDKKVAVSELDASPDQSASVGVPMGGPKLKVGVAPSDKGMRMSFPWPDTTAAAVFQRAGQFWVVFDEPSSVDLSVVRAKLADRFSSVEQIPSDKATILRFLTRKTQYPDVRKDADTWTIDLTDVTNPPVTPIDVREQVTDNKTARLFLPVKDPGLKLDIDDPLVGDKLVVVPVLGGSFGVDGTRNYAEFRLIGTPQGVVVEPKADWLSIHRESTGVEIAGTRALAHSSSDPGGQDAVAAMQAQTGGGQLIDFDAWAMGPDRDYWDNLDKLLYDLSLAPEDGRNSARWTLARFYIAHRQAADALGVLDLMAKSDVRLEEDPQFRAVRGVADIFMERYADAEQDLSFPRLDAEPHAALWRAVAESELGKNEAALDHYHQGLDAITSYRETDRARFQLAAVKAELGLGDAASMSSEISVLEGLKLPDSMKAETEYLKGRMYELQDDPTSALDAYAQAIATDYRPVTAQAQFRQIELNVKQGKITPKEEIDQLDALRFRWRGGPLEFQVLHTLGERYVAAGKYRDGLEIMRQAVTYFPESDDTRAITREMNKMFRDLFLAGGADKMSPVAALGLYYDFRELTPLGSDGDEMIRKLSDRLVDVDLLDKAEELLEHQVNYRLKGAAQAQVAARLARVYLLDRKPEQAVKIIDDTRQVLLPTSLGHMRLMLEAKALAEMKHYDEAIGTLEGIPGEDAELIRSDIYWASNDWNKLAESAAKVLGDRWQKPDPLEPVERQTVMRWAVALALENDKSGLVDLQKKFGKLMAATPAANAFDVVTTTVDPTGINLRDLTSQIASVNTIEKLFKDYSQAPAPAS